MEWGGLILAQRSLCGVKPSSKQVISEREGGRSQIVAMARADDVQPHRQLRFGDVDVDRRGRLPTEPAPISL
jgi:hypothetical protein